MAHGPIKKKMKHLPSYLMAMMIKNNGGDKMVRVHAKENESIDKLIQRFKSAVKKSNILLEVKNREYFLKKSLKRQRKAEQSRLKYKK